MSAAKVLFHGRGFIAVEKPAGALVIPGRNEEDGACLQEVLEQELGVGKLWVVHRLDRDTSGVLLFAQDAQTHRALSMAFEAGRVEKSYLALVRGALVDAQDVHLSLAPARRGRMRPVRPGEDGKGARTLVRPVESFGTLATLVEAQPLTGRTHQIRVHLSSLGHPLLYDHQYGGAKLAVTASLLGGEGDEIILQRTPLHAARVRLLGIEGVQDAEITSPLPADMARALSLLRARG